MRYWPFGGAAFQQSPRCHWSILSAPRPEGQKSQIGIGKDRRADQRSDEAFAVSYTHLTLPTICSV
eukprot:9107287-Alexandrium_andersonii.AAC.1